MTACLAQRQRGRCPAIECLARDHYCPSEARTADPNATPVRVCATSRGWTGMLTAGDRMWVGGSPSHAAEGCTGLLAAGREARGRTPRFRTRCVSYWERRTHQASSYSLDVRARYLALSALLWRPLSPQTEGVLVLTEWRHRGRPGDDTITRGDAKEGAGNDQPIKCWCTTHLSCSLHSLWLLHRPIRFSPICHPLAPNCTEQVFRPLPSSITPRLRDRARAQRQRRGLRISQW